MTRYKFTWKEMKEIKKNFIDFEEQLLLLV